MSPLKGAQTSAKVGRDQFEAVARGGQRLAVLPGLEVAGVFLKSL